MKLEKDSRILIVGLGLIGGSYAKALKKQGFRVTAIDTRPEAIAYALRENIVDEGYTAVKEEAVRSATLVVFALYPKVFTAWIADHQHLLAPGTLLTDVTGVKSCLVYEIQAMLRNDVEYIAAHPMAGREVYGVENSDEKIFCGANYIVVPTEKNTEEAIALCERLGKTLGFARISRLTPEEHDEMIGFVSQLTHVIAVTLMTCCDNTHLVDYTGDSFRDLTRIARINDGMWSELFLLNRPALLRQMDLFLGEFARFRELLDRGDEEGMREKMRLSSARRALFDKK